MKKKLFAFTVFISLLGIPLVCYNLQEIKNLVIRGPLATIYVSLRDKGNFDQDHVITTLDNGMKIIVNRHDRCVCWFIRLLGRWDSSEKKVVEKIVKPGQSIVEIGSNFGCYTLLMADLAGTEGKIYAFEANPDVSKYLKESVKLNHLTDNVEVFANAVADKPYSGFMIYGTQNIGGGYILPDNPESRQTCMQRKCTPIQAVTLDSVLKDKKIDILKMDAEGAEAWILEGSKELLRYNRNIVIIMEWVVSHFKRNGVSPENLLQNLVDQKFNFWKITRKGTLEPVTSQELLGSEAADIVVSRQPLTDFFTLKK